MTPNRQSPALALFARHRYPAEQQIRQERINRPVSKGGVVTRSYLVRIVRLSRFVISGRFAVISLRATAFRNWCRPNPDFLWILVVPSNCMRLSVKKAAHHCPR
jgi:hypothetical protein